MKNELVAKQKEMVMSYIDDSLNNDTRNLLKDTIERIENLIAEKTQASEAIKAEFATAKSAGFDTKAINQILKERKADLDKTVKHRRIVSVYRTALSGLAGTELGDWARRFESQTTLHEVRKGEEKIETFSKMLDRYGKGASSSPPSEAGP